MMSVEVILLVPALVVGTLWFLIHDDVFRKLYDEYLEKNKK